MTLAGPVDGASPTLGRALSRRGFFGLLAAAAVVKPATIVKALSPTRAVNPKTGTAIRFVQQYPVLAEYSSPSRLDVLCWAASDDWVVPEGWASAPSSLEVGDIT